MNKIKSAFLAFFRHAKAYREINKGFQIDIPNVFVPWDITEESLKVLFNGFDLKFVIAGYCTIECTSFKDLTCMIGFHFEPRSNGRLKLLEFFRANYNDQQMSFDEFQKVFQNRFGRPSNKSKGNDGFNNYSWILGDILIEHYVYNRFGLEEHVHIKRTK